MARRRLVWPALTTTMMLCLTLWLGVWQVHRLHWKQGLLAEIDRGEATAPEPLTENPRPFSRVSIRGVFLPVTARYGAEVRNSPEGGRMGARLLGVLQGAAPLPVLVDRGWAPVDTPNTAPAGPVTLEGYVRPREVATWLSAADEPMNRRFFTLDPPKIGAALGLPGIEPFTIVALGPQTPGAIPDPARAMPRPPNDHLTYAITWFSLSAVLVAVFALFVRSTLRANPA